MRTLSALIQVNKDESGSCREVSMGFLLPMKIGDCLQSWSECPNAKLVSTHHPDLLISSAKMV